MALTISAPGACVAIVMGALQVASPRPVEDALVGDAVLAAAFVCDGASGLVSLRRFVAAKGSRGFDETTHRAARPRRMPAA